MASHKLPLYHPAALIATCFGLGRWRFLTPDMSGSLVAAVILFLCFPDAASNHALLLFGTIVTLAGWFACNYYLRHSSDRNITEIAIDGFIGMLASVLFFHTLADYISVYPLSGNRFYNLFFLQALFSIGALFFLFRFFHGWRIGFARITSTGVRGATSIIGEAVSAALLASICLHATIIATEYVGGAGAW